MRWETPWTVVATAGRAQNAETARSRGASRRFARGSEGGSETVSECVGTRIQSRAPAAVVRQNDGQSERLLRTAPSSALTCVAKRRGQLWQRRAVRGTPGPLALAALRAAPLAALKAYLKAYPKAFPKSFLNALGRAFRAANGAPAFARTRAGVSGHRRADGPSLARPVATARSRRPRGLAPFAAPTMHRLPR